MRRNHLITLQRLDASKQWVDVMTMHAAVNRVKGTENFDGGVIQSPMSLCFDVRYCQAIADLRLNTQKYRILYAGASYKITEYDDYFERHRNVRLTGVSYIGSKGA